MSLNAWKKQNSRMLYDSGIGMMDIAGSKEVLIDMYLKRRKTMKKFLAGLMAIALVFNSGGRVYCDDGQKLKGTITMSGAWALYPMAVKWAEEFQKLHPEVRVDISAGGAGKGMADAISGVVDIGKVSREIYPEEIEKGVWWVAVVKDAVVPTINSMNPACPELLARGITKEQASGIWITEEITEWSDVAGPMAKGEINVYTRSDSCGAAETWASFLGSKQEDLAGVGVYGDPGLASAVINDVNGIGFNNINYAYDTGTGEQLSGIRIVPLDSNGSGKIDPEEDFYGNRASMVSAIAEGKYPSPPARDLYFVCKGRPDRVLVAEFIRWVLTDGQKFTAEAGYVGLSQRSVIEGLEKLKAE